MNEPTIFPFENIFIKLTTTKCPVCNAEIVSYSRDEGSTIFQDNKIYRHTNGEIREKVTFACGGIIEYCPNFSREVAGYRKCPFSIDTINDLQDKIKELKLEIEKTENKIEELQNKQQIGAYKSYDEYFNRNRKKK